MVIGRNDLQPYELDWREFALGRTCKNVRNVRPTVELAEKQLLTCR